MKRSSVFPNSFIKAQLGISWKNEPMISHRTLKRMNSSGLGHEYMAEHMTMLMDQTKPKKLSTAGKQLLNIENTVDPLSAVKLSMTFKPCLLINLILCSGINK